jgi:hypothetical protein
MPAFVSKKCLSVQLLTLFTTRCRIILPTFACRNNVGSQGTISTKLPWWRRSSGSTTLLSAMLSQRSRLQRIRQPNHRVCRHLLRLIALFAAWALGISSPPNQHSRGSHTAMAVEDLAEREPPSQAVCGPPTYRNRYRKLPRFTGKLPSVQLCYRT